MMIVRRSKRLFKQSRFRWLLIGLIILSIFLGIVIVPVEKDVGNITTVIDGLWWAVSTVTTVGYGDFVPVTNAGKLIGIVLQISGAVLFGLVVAMIGSTMARSQEEIYWGKLFERMSELADQLSEVKKRTEFLVKGSSKKNEPES